MTFSKNKTCAVLLLLLSMSLVYCKTSHKTVAAAPQKPAPTVSYTTDIAPIIARSCSPCHFPAEGKKEPLDTYAAAKENISDILTRVQLPATDIKYMPFKGKKAPLTEAEIQKMKDWVKQDMPK